MRVCNTCGGTGVVKNLHNWATGGTREQACWNCREVEAQQPAPSAAAHVGDSLFESWFSEYNPAHRGTKQQMRDAYAAGMGDPKAQPSPTPRADSQPAGVTLNDAIEISKSLGVREYGPNTRNWSFEYSQLAQFVALLTAAAYVDADRAARATADSVTAPAGGVAAVPVKQCPGIPRPGCNYLAQCESVCNKCGKLHSTRFLEDSQPAAAARRWNTYEEAIADPVFQTARSIMGTENIGQDRQLVKAINHVIDSTPPAQAADSVLEDAARYRHLRDCNSGSLVVMQITGMGEHDRHVLTEDDADAAIDAARKQGGAT